MPYADGAAQLRALGLRLKAAGAGDLRRELLAGIRTGAKPLVEAVRQAARDDLPKAGGLAERVASSPIATRTRLSGSSVGVRIVNTAKGVNASGNSGDVRFGTDRGIVRHPVFGHRDRWVNQTITVSGWFTKTLERESPKVAPDVLAAMESVAAKVTGRL